MSKKLSFSKRSDLYHDEYYNYIVGLLKEIIPMQLVKLKEYDLMLKSESLLQQINSITDVFNICFSYEEDFPKIRKDVERVLRDRYHYVIKQDTPFVMEKVSSNECIELIGKDFGTSIKKFKRMRNQYKKSNGISPCFVIQLSENDNTDDYLNNVVFHELNKKEYQNLKWVLISDIDEKWDTNDLLDIKKLPLSKWKDYIENDSSSIDVVIFKGTSYKDWNISRTVMIFKGKKINNF